MSDIKKTSIKSTAPIRICDNGGWTDTWFSGYGEIFNIAVSPFAEVQIEVQSAVNVKDRIVIHAENFGDYYVFDPCTNSADKGWVKHPLLEASIKSMDLPEELAYEITITSQAPSGASTGTSAAVAVALIGALDACTPGRMTPKETAIAAHKVETELLRQQCGIQDQICSAYGGINYIIMSNFPDAEVIPIQLSNRILSELELRLALIYLGSSHSSTSIHDAVIHRLESAGFDNPQLDALRKTAARSRDALLAGDFIELGKVMIDNNDAQGALHPDLICGNAQRIIDIAKAFNAAGWKVNGAGGDGGSLTLLCSENSKEKAEMIKAIEQVNSKFENIPIKIAPHGLQVWINDQPSPFKSSSSIQN